MRYHEPRFIATINAATVTAIYIVFYLLGVTLIFHGTLHDLYPVLFLVVTALVIFLVSYYISHYTLERFIYSKIRLIYKSIHSIKSGKEKPARRTNGSGNLLETVGKDVEVWKEEKSMEIEQLKQLEQYRRDFIGNVSHELKTPLFNVQGYILTLLDGGLDDPTINTEYLKRTEKSVERLIRIVEDLDEIAQLESGEMQLKITRFDIVALALEVLEILDLKAQKAGISLFAANPEKPVFVEGDREKIRQVLTNIIGNSIRYGTKGGKTKISFFDMGDNILTEITDNGIGIDAEDLPRVFERFYRTQRGRSASKSGKGLGLAIVKHIMEAHQQTVSVRSSIGIGTTFGFTLKKMVQP
jgi:two-component system, OmpR family, phosphate regulon sensor histidine kinase PhoR